MSLVVLRNTPVSGPYGPLTRRYAPDAASPCRDHSDGAQNLLCRCKPALVWQEGGGELPYSLTPDDLTAVPDSLLSRTEKPRAILRGRIASLPCAARIRGLSRRLSGRWRVAGTSFSLPCHVFSLLVNLFVSLFVYNINIPFMRRLTDAPGNVRTRTDY